MDGHQLSPRPGSTARAATRGAQDRQRLIAVRRDETAEPQDHTAPARGGESCGLGFRGADRTRRSTVADRGRRHVDPGVAMISVQERDRLLYVACRAGGERGIHEVAGTFGADATVFLPRTRVGHTRRRRDMRRQVADRVVAHDRGAQLVGIEEAGLYRRRAERPCERSLGGRPHECGHLVACGGQGGHRPAPEHTCRSGNEDPHRTLPSSYSGRL